MIVLKNFLNMSKYDCFYDIIQYLNSILTKNIHNISELRVTQFFSG